MEVERWIIRVLPKVFTGKYSSGEFAASAITSKVLAGTRPDRPQGTRILGLTDLLWDMTVRCWHQLHARRPNMMEVVGLLRKMPIASLSMEADLRDFFEVCKTRGKDGQGEKAREFADELDEVRHSGRRNVNSSHHTSRHLETQVFARKHGSNIYGTCKRCVALLTFFRPRFCSHKNPSN